MKAILFHVQDDDTLQNGLENAQAIARATDGHLHCLHAVPSSAYVTGGGLGDDLSSDKVADHLENIAASLRKQVEDDLANEGIGYDYQHVEGDVADAITMHSSLCDLIVTSRQHPRGRKRERAVSRLGEILHRTRTPIFIPGDNGAEIDVGGTAIIGWDGTKQAANAVRQTVPILKLAGEVRAVRVKQKEDRFPDTRLLEYLSFHGIKAELHVETMKEKDMISPILFGHAEEADRPYIVMGAYSRSRLDEYLFGGVTRTILKGAPVGVFLAH